MLSLTLSTTVALTREIGKKTRDRDPIPKGSTANECATNGQLADAVKINGIDICTEDASTVVLCLCKPFVLESPTSRPSF